MIIAFSGEKGGTGKTTLASNYAIMLAIDGSDVLLIDADPQGSISEFARARDEQGLMPEITCTQGFGAGLNSEIRKFTSKFDDIVVDVGGKDSDTLRSVLTIAEIIIVPFSNSKLDLWSLANFNLLIKEAKLWNTKLKCFLVLNKADTNTKINTFAYSEELKKLDEMILIEPIISYRIAFRRAIAEGQAVTELRTKGDKKAMDEIKKFYLEIQNYE